MTTQLVFFLLGIGTMAFMEHYTPKVISFFKKEESKIESEIGIIKSGFSKKEVIINTPTVTESSSDNQGEVLSGPPSYLTTTSTP